MKLKILQVREASGGPICSPDVVAEMMREEGRADRECFWVLHLNVRNRVIEKELVAIGSVANTVVHPREVFKKAIILGAANIITMHNHPGGIADPSPEDRTIWKRLNEVGEIMGIGILDHLIVTPSGEYYSQKEGKTKRREGNNNGQGSQTDRSD